MKAKARFLTCAMVLTGLASGLGQQLPATIQFSAAAYRVAEDAGTALITVLRAGDTNSATTADYATSDGTAKAGADYASQSGTLRFAAGETNKTFTISIFDDGLVEGDETLNVALSKPTGGAALGSHKTALLTIRDNEQPVFFDPSFASKEALFAPDDNYPCVQALALQPDGKVVIGGCFTDVGGFSRRGIARLNGDGSVDLSFDPGSGIGNSSRNGEYPTVLSLALLGDGKMLLGGNFFSVNGSIHPGLALLNSDGTLDEAFKADAGVIDCCYSDVRQVIIQHDGKILFAGYFTDGPGVARLNADGSLDATFLSKPALPPMTQLIMAIALQADGKILVGGKVCCGDDHPYLIRLTADGSLDNTFSSALPNSLGAGFAISAVAPQLDGKILASGYDINESDGNYRSVIFRLNSDGSPDPTFNTEPNQNLYVRQILVLANGEVLAVGYPGGVWLNANGSLDRLFSLGDVSGVAIQPDGLIIAVGSFAGGVARIFPELSQPGGPEFTVSTVTVPETIGTAVLSVQRLGDTSQEMTVDFTTSDGTARAGLDYVAQTGTVRFAPLQVTNTISIAIINDSLVDDPKSFQVILSNPSSGSSLQLFRTIDVVITSNDIGIQFASDTFTVNEAAGFAEVLVTRSGDGLGAAAVDYSSSDGTAKAGADYLARSGTIIFASGETNQTIQIPILDDGLVEGDETIHLTLTNPKAGAMLGSRTNATLMIIDNEIPALIDPSFDPGRGATDGLGNPGDILGIAVQPDGKIVVSGSFSRFNGAAGRTLARLNPDGSVDASFRPPSLSFDYSVLVLAQPDGKVLFLYYLNGVPNLLRLNADGASDPSFRSTRFESGDSNFAVVLQPDGRILIGGRFDRVDGVAQKNLARLNADGTLDTAFKIGAGPSTRINGSEQGQVDAIVLQPDGKILISGSFNSFNGTPVNGSARLNADGSLDEDFSASDYSYSHVFLAAQPDGKILVLRGGVISRLNPDGSRDASFNAPNTSVSYTQSGYHFALQTDGKILFIGRATEHAPQDDLFRLNSDGSLDTTLLPLAIRDANKDVITPTAFAVQADGGILVAFTFQYDGRTLVAGDFISVNGLPRSGMVRLFGNLSGTPDISFAAANWSASENSDLAVITIQRSGDTSQPASIHYATQDSTALANLNYLPTSGTLDFAPLENEKTIVIPLFDDELPSADTRVSLTLSNPSEGTIISAGLNTATLTIADSQRPGSVDSTFNPLIETTNGFPSGFHIALQPDGKVIVAGDFQRVNGVTRNGICRLNPDGSLDSSLDPKGGLAALPDENGSVSPLAIYSLALQPDGKILVRGSFNSVSGLNYTNFVRFNPEGSVDTTFIPDAAARPDQGHYGSAAMAVQPDGKILVAEGIWGKPDELGRLAADGSADTNFVTLEVVGVSGAWVSTFNVIVVEGDGRALFEGNSDPAAPVDGEPQQGLTRLNADGSIDESFHPMMDILSSGFGGSMNAAVVQPDGKIVIAGAFSQVNGVNRPGLARLNPDGSTDASFAPASNYYIISLALQADGKFLGAGANGSIVRLNADGSRDLTFDATVELAFDFGGEGWKQYGLATTFSDIVVLPDGQILVAGNFTSPNGGAWPGLVRLNGDARLANSRARLRSITGAGTGKVQLNLDVVPSRTYAIQASSDLINWTAIATLNATNYLLNVADSAAGISHRFYRAVQTAPDY